MQRARIIGLKNEKTATGAIFVRMCDIDYAFNFSYIKKKKVNRKKMS